MTIFIGSPMKIRGRRRYSSRKPCECAQLEIRQPSKQGAFSVRIRRLAHHARITAVIRGDEIPATSTAGISPQRRSGRRCLFSRHLILSIFRRKFVLHIGRLFLLTEVEMRRVCIKAYLLPAYAEIFWIKLLGSPFIRRPLLQSVMAWL